MPHHAWMVWDGEPSPRPSMRAPVEPGPAPPGRRAGVIAFATVALIGILASIAVINSVSEPVAGSPDVARDPTLVQVRGITSESSRWIDVGWITEFPIGSVTHLRSTDDYLVVTGQGPMLIINRSTYRGEPVFFCRSSNTFRDRVHGSVFDAQGRLIAGPAARGLDRHPVRVASGRVEVDSLTVLAGPPRGTRTDPPAGSFCRGNE